MSESIEFNYQFFKSIAPAFIEANVTDFHIAADTPPYIRQAGAMQILEIPGRDEETGEPIAIEVAPLTGSDVEKFVTELLQDSKRADDPEIAENFIRDMHQHEIDTTLSILPDSPDGQACRFRIHVSRQRGTFSVSIRVIPETIPPIKGFPPEVKAFTQYKNGFIIVSGKAGSGKSTTLASFIDEINHTQQKKIITLEDPIEYLHKHDKSMIIQREIGIDTQSYKTGLLSALREDPDIIVIGELRDIDSFEIALNAAETGCLVLTTMHASDTTEALERIVSMFSEDKQNQIRSQLSVVLRGVICQQLVPCMSPEQYGAPLVCAVEVMTSSKAMSNIIRSGNFKAIQSNMQTSAGNRLMRDSLRFLKDQGLISEQEWFNRDNQIENRAKTSRPAQATLS